MLKDAASTAIYGARGANGVILVTTKGGHEGKPTVKYNMYYQIQKNPETLDVLDAYDYVYWTWAYSTAYGQSYGDGIANYFGVGSANGNHMNEYKNVAAHNYIDDIMRTAHSWNHDVSLSGGNSKTTYYAAVNYMDNEGIREGTSFNRWNANFKLTQKINKDLTFDADLRYSEMRFQGSVRGYETTAYKYRPIDNPLGDATNIGAFGNGNASVDEEMNIVDIMNSYQMDNKRQRIRARGALTWKVIPGLTARTELSLSRNWNEKKDWDGGFAGDKVAKLTKGNGYGVRWATTLNYEIQGLGEDHSASILAGNEVLASKSNSSFVQGAGYPKDFSMDDAFGMLSMTNPDLGKDQFSNTIGTPEHTQSWFGRANYSFKGRYLLTATFRADGSSKFAPGKQWGYFPAGAVAWRISDEAFMKGTEDWLNNLKLRLSYGTSGSDNISPSLWKETWTTKNITVNGNPVTSYVPGDMLGNPDLKWETTVSRNVGIDFGFFNNRIHGSLDVYWNTTKDLLMRVPVDPSTGYTYQYQNVGETSNKGIELSLAADLIRTKDFNLRFGATYNYNKNNVEELLDGVQCDVAQGWGSTMRRPTYDYIIRVGEPVGLINGYKSLGFYTPNDFDIVNGQWILKEGIPDMKVIGNYVGGQYYNLPEGQSAFPGMAKFEDVDGSGTVTEDDCTIIGRTMPKHTGGFNFTGRYKDFDFAANFTYQIGGDIYNANAMHSMMGNKDTGFGENRLAYVADCYKIFDIDANGDLYAVTDPDALNKMNAGAKYATPFGEYGITTSQFIEDASYLRLQTITLGYTLSKSLTKKVGISNLRVYATASNLFCLTGYSGLDPDVNSGYGGQSGFPTPGYDYQSYPKARTYTFGLNVTF